MSNQLQFSVIGQKIVRTDNFFVAAESMDYLAANFAFVTKDWCGIIKNAIFIQNSDPYTVMLDDSNSCLVPWEVIKPPLFYVSLFGKGEERTTITTNKLLIEVRRSGFKRGEIPREPSPTIYEQLLEQYHSKGDSIKIVNNELSLLSGNEVLSTVGLPAGGGEEESNYLSLSNKPLINGVQLEGDKSLEELGLHEISNTEIEEIIKNIGGL